MLFTVFAFVVLLGTVFPLLVEALQDRQHRRRRPVLRPALDADRAGAAVPDGGRAGAAVAQGEHGAAARPAVLAGRGAAPARSSSPSLVGADGWAPLVAFGLAGFAAGSALRQVVLATRRQGWRGLVGRANGGMVVHIGVIVIAVALAASNSYTRSATLALDVGAAVEWGGHTFELAGTCRENGRRPVAQVVVADVLLDGGDVYRPAITQVPPPGQGRRHAERADRAHQGHLPDAGAGAAPAVTDGDDPGVRSSR